MRRPGGLSLSPLETPSAPSRRPSCAGEGVRSPGRRHTFPHRGAGPRQHTMNARTARGTTRLLLCPKHAGPAGVRALTAPELA